MREPQEICVGLVDIGAAADILLHATDHRAECSRRT